MLNNSTVSPMKFEFRYISAVLFLGFIIIACMADHEAVMKGDWQVIKMEAQFDEQRVNPAMLAQLLSLEKQTLLRFANDSVVTLISDGNKTTYVVSIQIDGRIFIAAPNDSVSENKHLFGQIQDGIIRRVSNTPIGNVVLYFEKVK